MTVGGGCGHYLQTNKALFKPRKNVIQLLHTVGLRLAVALGTVLVDYNLNVRTNVVCVLFGKC